MRARSGLAVKRLFSRMIFACVVVAFLATNGSHACAENAPLQPPVYPAVWERQGVREVFYLDGTADEIALPNGLPDLAVDYPQVEQGGWILPLLFSGKRVRVASFDRQRLVATLPSGATFRLLGKPADGSWERDAATSGRQVDGLQLGDVFVRPDGAKFGFEQFTIADVRYDGIFRCDGASGGVAGFDAAGHVLWRKTYFGEQKNVPDADWGFCEHRPNGRRLVAQRVLVGFSDGTLGVLVGNTLLRVSAAAGLPVEAVRDIQVVDSAKVVDFRTAAYARLSVVGNTSMTQSAEALYYERQVKFFFAE